MIEQTLFGEINLVQTAIERMKFYEPPEGYYLAFSGGKDSIVLKALADMAGVKYQAFYNMTTIDPPEVVKFIREYYPDVVFNRPDESFFKLLIKKGFPIRQKRWCCDLLKERSGVGRVVMTGIRWAESNRRAQRSSVERSYKDRKTMFVNAIIEWSEDDIWEFIKVNKMPYCKLYDEGWKRIGCLFCPMAGTRRKIEAEKYPKFVVAYINAFEKLYQRRKQQGQSGVDRWASGREMFDWWMNEERRPQDDPDQCVLFE
jgi:phosphoadenosine phosphosulfate reductase